MYVYIHIYIYIYICYIIIWKEGGRGPRAQRLPLCLNAPSRVHNHRASHQVRETIRAIRGGVLAIRSVPAARLPLVVLARLSGTIRGEEGTLD